MGRDGTRLDLIGVKGDTGMLINCLLIAAAVVAVAIFAAVFWWAAVYGGGPNDR